jgi:hypothetical protein
VKRLKNNIGEKKSKVCDFMEVKESSKRRE